MPNGSAIAENKLQTEHRQNQKVRNHTNQIAPQWLVYRLLAVVSYSFFNELAGKNEKCPLQSFDNRGGKASVKVTLPRAGGSAFGRGG